MDEEITEEQLHEAFSILISYLLDKGYGEKDLMQMGPHEALRIAEIEKSFEVTE